MSAAVWGEVANAAIQAGSAYLNYNAQRDANVKNLRSAREQREFEREMSNTAVQRRAADIEAAGGNRALAFVNGSEASTPVYTPARVEAPHFDAPRFNTAALLTQAQLDNVKSQTYKNSAETESVAIDNKFKQAVLDGKIQYTNLGQAQDYENKVAQGNKIRQEISNLTTENVAKQIANYVLNNTKEDTIQAIKNDAILKNLHIDKEIPGAMWARIKAEILGILETKP